MGLADYFKLNRYVAKYSIGDRVFGHYKKIPFVGTIGNDTQISEHDGPYVTVHLDLPLKVDGEVKNVVRVKHKDIKSYK